jgi:uncharacterized protein (TIGR02118 family)
MREVEALVTTILISAVYPNEAGSRFDAAYYRERHTPLAIALLEPHGLTGLRTAIGEAGLDGAPPPYWAICEMTFTSRAAFDAALARQGAAIFADIPNYTTVTPVLQVSRLDPVPPFPTPQFPTGA